MDCGPKTEVDALFALLAAAPLDRRRCQPFVPKRFLKKFKIKFLKIFSIDFVAIKKLFYKI